MTTPAYNALNAEGFGTTDGNPFDWNRLKASILENQFADTAMSTISVYFLNRTIWTDYGVAILITLWYLFAFACWIGYHYLNMAILDIQFPDQSSSAAANSGSSPTPA